MPVLIFRKHKHSKGELEKVSSTARKCPFCTAVNDASRKTCRKCHLTLLQYNDLIGTGVRKTYQISLRDIRSPFQRLADYVDLIPALIIAIPFILKYLLGWKGEENKSLLEFSGAAILVIVPLYYFVFGSPYSVQMCRNCGKAMVIRIPIRRVMFPHAVQCWSCGAKYEIDWDMGKRQRISGSGMNTPRI